MTGDSLCVALFGDGDLDALAAVLALRVDLRQS